MQFVCLLLHVGERHYLQKVLGHTCPSLHWGAGGSFPKLELGLC